MFNPHSTTIWYGRRETMDLGTPVIFDPALPGVPTGQVYLYHSGRWSIVPYDEKIVGQYLRGVDPQEGRNKLKRRQSRR